MTLSRNGLVILARREGTRPTMYRDSAGLPTIGVGHLLTKDESSSGRIHLPSGIVDWRNGLSDEQIQELLRLDVTTAEDAVTSAVSVPLTQTQFDTLVSFTFNVGILAFAHSTLLVLLNRGDYEAVPHQLPRWIHSAGAVDAILVKRRDDEVAQWEGKA